MSAHSDWVKKTHVEAAVFRAAFAIALQGDESTYTGPHQAAWIAGSNLGAELRKERNL